MPASHPCFAEKTKKDTITKNYSYYQPDLTKINDIASQIEKPCMCAQTRYLLLGPCRSLRNTYHSSLQTESDGHPFVANISSITEPHSKPDFAACEQIRQWISVYDFECTKIKMICPCKVDTFKNKPSKN